MINVSPSIDSYFCSLQRQTQPLFTPYAAPINNTIALDIFKTIALLQAELEKGDLDVQAEQLQNLDALVQQLSSITATDKTREILVPTIKAAEICHELIQKRLVANPQTQTGLKAFLISGAQKIETGLKRGLKKAKQKTTLLLVFAIMKASIKSEIRESEEAKLDAKIEKLENALADKKQTLTASRETVEAIIRYFTYHIVDIEKVAVEQRLPFLSHLFENMCSESPTPNGIGRTVLLFLRDHADFVKKVLYANVLNMMKNAYKKASEIETSHPFILFELIYKGLEAIHAHKGDESSQIVQGEKSSQELFSSILRDCIFPMFFPHGVDDLIIPDIFTSGPNFPGKKGPKEYLLAKIKKLLDEKIPPFVGEKIAEAVRDPATKTMVLVKIYRKIVRAFNSLSDLAEIPPVTERSIPEEMKTSCINAISNSLTDIATGPDRTSRFIQTFSTQLAERLMWFLELVLAETTPVDAVEELFCFAAGSAKKYFSRRTGFKAPSLPSAQKLTNFKEQLRLNIEDLFSIIWSQIRSNSLPLETFTDVVREIIRHIKDACIYLVLRLFFAITQAKDFLEMKRQEAEVMCDNLTLEPLLSKAADSILGLRTEYATNPQGSQL